MRSTYRIYLYLASNTEQIKVIFLLTLKQNELHDQCQVV